MKHINNGVSFKKIINNKSNLIFQMKLINNVDNFNRNNSKMSYLYNSIIMI